MDLQPFTCNVDLANRQLYELEKQSGEKKCLRNPNEGYIDILNHTKIQKNTYKMQISRPERSLLSHRSLVIVDKSL